MNIAYKNLIKFGLSILILIAILAMGYEYVKYGSVLGTNSSYRTLYKKALELEKNDRYRDAYYTFAKITPRYLAYDAVLFHQAQCAAKIEDELTVIKKSKYLISKYDESPLAPQAAYNLARAYLRIREFEKAKETFLDITKKYNTTDYAIGSYYYLGELNKDEDEKAALDYWKKYIALSPNGRFSLECIEKILNSHTPLSDRDTFHLGIALYSTQQYRKAISYLSKLTMEQSWYYLAKSYQKTRNRSKALSILKDGLKRYSIRLDEAKLWDAMRTYVALDYRYKTRSWNDLIKLTQNGKDFAMYNKAILLTQKQAFPLYKKIAEKYPNGKFASESLWQVFWNHYSKKEYAKAIEVGKRHISNYSNTMAAPKILFWMGKTCEMLNKNIVADSYYDRLLDRYPDSYYAFRAKGRKIAIKRGEDPGWVTDVKHSLNKKKYKFDYPYELEEIKKQFGYLTAELMKTKDLDMLLSIDKRDEFITSWVKYNQGLKTKSIVIARNQMAEIEQKPDKSDIKWQYIYPLFYTEKINDYAKINKIDPIIIISLMREESYFNPFAVSSSNARGLMQLLPGTARDIARWKNLGSVNDLKLFDPEVNIKLGSGYLGYVKDRLNGSTLYAVGSYNGGPGAVEKWIKNTKTYDMDEFIENIPYDQTRDYVKKVYRSYWNYKRIYEIK